MYNKNKLVIFKEELTDNTQYEQKSSSVQLKLLFLIAVSLFLSSVILISFICF